MTLDNFLCPAVMYLYLQSIYLPGGAGYSHFCLLQGLGLFIWVKILNFAICLGVEVLSTIFMGMPVRAGIWYVIFHRYSFGVSLL